ncbi:sugar transferase [Streptacidiphilus melanogenes]|uniref:sugar transferase n=1 Tax=Streptacidiphilus melanogenes TaxID=411235 RepID=UPI0022870EA2|nr:sugar transferase [Streptacidiphilus melanogenes]
MPGRHLWRASAPEESAAPSPYRGKRLLDLAVVCLALAPALVLCAAAAAAHLMAHGRPVLFRQPRVGRDGRPFVLWKLRTMADPKDESGRSAGADLARVTAVGRVLRRLSLDELPQLLNVMRGEMSLVGPRPTLAYQVHRYTDRQLVRLRALPGLTGLAQVRGRQRLTWPERIEWDLRYVRHQSLRLDLTILLLTVWAVLARGGTTVGHDNDPIARTSERIHPGA